MQETPQPLRLSPKFREALAGYCEVMTALPPSGWNTRKLIHEFARYYAAYMLIMNYYGWKAGVAPLPSLARLKAVSGMSPRQTAAVVSAFRAGGLVTAEAAEADRRQTLLRPEPSLVLEVGRSTGAFLAAYDRVQGTNLAPRICASADQLGTLIFHAAVQVLQGGTTIAAFPTVQEMATLDCGYLILVAVMQAHYDPSRGELRQSLTYEALASRFRISRSHAGNVLNRLQASGKLTADRSPAPALIDEFERWCETEMTFYPPLARRMIEAEK